MVKGHAAIIKQTVEVVDAVASELKGDIACLEKDLQHFANALVEAMKEATSLKN